MLFYLFLFVSTNFVPSSDLAAKLTLGNFLPSVNLAAKFFGLSMVSTNSYRNDCQNSKLAAKLPS